MARTSERVENADFNGCCKVIFNLVTSGLEKTAEIYKIAACTEKNQFKSYIMPSNGIRPIITDVTGLRVVNNRLYENDVRVDHTDSAKTAITKFLNFLETQGQSVILVAHNADGFHGPRILRLVRGLGMMDEFKSRVAGFACTLRLFENEFPERKYNNLEVIARDIPGFNWESQAVYNATCKAQILMEVIRHYRIENRITKHTESVEAALTRVETNDRKASLEKFSGLSTHIREKIAKAGIDYVNLKEAFQSGGNEKVLQLLHNVKLRQKVIDEILEHLRVSVP